MKRVITLASLCSICLSIYYIYRPEINILLPFKNELYSKNIVDKLIAPSLANIDNDTGE